jgi:hypothetical protein
VGIGDLLAVLRFWRSLAASGHRRRSAQAAAVEVDRMGLLRTLIVNHPRPSRQIRADGMSTGWRGGEELEVKP